AQRLEHRILLFAQVQPPGVVPVHVAHGNDKLLFDHARVQRRREIPGRGGNHAGDRVALNAVYAQLRVLSEGVRLRFADKLVQVLESEPDRLPRAGIHVVDALPPGHLPVELPCVARRGHGVNRGQTIQRLQLKYQPAVRHRGRIVDRRGIQPLLYPVQQAAGAGIIGAEFLPLGGELVEVMHQVQGHRVAVPLRTGEQVDELKLVRAPRLVETESDGVFYACDYRHVVAPAVSCSLELRVSAASPGAPIGETPLSAATATAPELRSRRGVAQKANRRYGTIPGSNGRDFAGA